VNRQGNVMELSGNFTLSGEWSPCNNISMVKCKFACECLGYVDVMVRWVAEQMDTGFVNR